MDNEPKYLSWAWCAAFRRAAPCVRKLVYRQRRFQLERVGRLHAELGAKLDEAGASFRQLLRVAYAKGLAAQHEEAQAILDELSARATSKARAQPSLTLGSAQRVARQPRRRDAA